MLNMNVCAPLVLMTWSSWHYLQPALLSFCAYVMHTLVSGNMTIRLLKAQLLCTMKQKIIINNQNDHGI